MTPSQRYQQAHEYNFKKQYPTAYNDNHYALPKMQKVKTANGLTNFICNYINWMGWRATRIASTGRLIDGMQKQPSGVVLTTKKWIPGTTRKGTSDISATIKGRSIMIEIKVGNDRASEYQIKEQAKERSAGGVYEFIHNLDEFFQLYDSL